MIRRLRLGTVVLALSLGGACLPVFGEASSLTKETSLRSEPGTGERTAFVTPDTPVEVLEQRDGWVRVRIEGWVPQDAVAVTSPEPATSPPTTSARPPRAAPAPSSLPAGVPVEGLIKVKLGRLSKKVAAGAPVMLVPAGVDLVDEPTPDAAKRLADLEAESVRLQEEIEEAMQMSNFTEATQRRNELRRERDSILEERLQVLAAVHGRHEHTARAAAVASETTDSKGFFRIDSVPPGTYTLYARMSRDDVDVEWLEPVKVGSAALHVDLDESTARGMLPASR